MRIAQVTFLGFFLPLHDRKKKLVNPPDYQPYRLGNGKHFNTKWRGWTCDVTGTRVLIQRQDDSQAFEIPRAHCIVEYGPDLPVDKDKGRGKK